MYFRIPRSLDIHPYESIHVNGDKVNCPQGKRGCPGVRAEIICCKTFIIELCDEEYFLYHKAALKFISDAYLRYARRVNFKTTQ